MAAEEKDKGEGYGEQDYWDKRYAAVQESYDWYLNYSGFKDLLPPDITKRDAPTRAASRVLVLGCGSSNMAEELYDDGYREVISIDFSKVVIEKMQQAAAKLGRKELKYEVMDVRQLKFPDAHFELLMDKGTLDSVLCGSNSTENAAQMLREAYRVLKPGGFYVLVTYGRPQLRMPYLEQPRFRWDIAHQTVAKTRFLYILRKLRDGERPALRPVVPSSK